MAGDGIGVQVLSPLSLDICLGEDLHPRVTNNPVTKVEDGGMSERAVRDGGRTLTELRLLRACCFRGCRRGNSFLLKYSLAQIAMLQPLLQFQAGRRLSLWLFHLLCY